MLFIMVCQPVRAGKYCMGNNHTDLRNTGLRCCILFSHIIIECTTPTIFTWRPAKFGPYCKILLLKLSLTWFSVLDNFYPLADLPLYQNHVHHQGIILFLNNSYFHGVSTITQLKKKKSNVWRFLKCDLPQKRKGNLEDRYVSCYRLYVDL